MQNFAPIVMADDGLAARLAAIEDNAQFFAQLRQTAQSHGIELDETSLPSGPWPDPVRISKFVRPSLAGSALPPREWLPIAVTADDGAVAVDWARFGPEPFREPFYEDTIRRALRLPFNRVFRYRTGLHDLIAQAETLKSLAPAGFIFHMSRCGSTLVAQMLAALSDSIVISEAAPLDAVVQLARGLSDDDAVRALRAMVLAFGRKRSGQEQRYVVKLDCWHTLSLPLFRRAFPDVPWVFLYREPVEVLVSQLRQRGMQTVPQYFPPGFYGIAADEPTTEEDYCARVLAAVCRPIIARHETYGADSGAGLVLNYRELPGAVGSAILPHFCMTCSEAERDGMRRAAQQDAKTTNMPFTGDTDAKQRAATDNIRRAAVRHLGNIYRRLEVFSARAPSRQAADAISAPFTPPAGP